MGGAKNRRNHHQPTSPRPPQVTEKVKFPEEKKSPRPVKEVKLYHKKNELDDDWQPTFGAVVKMLLSIRIASALWGVINDCDEVYNYWEPLHMMIYGNGFQTWEYSPDYGIRSYFYLYCYYWPGKLFAYLFPDSKIAVFTLIRLCIGVFCLLGEYYAYTAICRKINVATGRFFIMFTICSSGMFVASTAFLPSSFAMALGFYCLGAHLYEQWHLAIFCVAFSALVGWPFAAALGIPIVVEMFLVKNIPGQFFRWSIFFGVLITGFVVYVDSKHFGKFIFAPLQIVLYNVLSGPGPELYGVESWTYYVKNLFLNWNIAFLFAIFAVVGSFTVYRRANAIPPGTPLRLGLPPDFVWVAKFAPVFLYTYTMGFWLIIFFTTPHKEERFMFPIYPHIAFLAALGCDAFNRLFRSKNSDDPEVIYSILVVFAVLSFSRGLAMYNNYGAHIEIYKALNDELNVHHDFSRFHNPIRVCVGKEWHRFPSHFFIPRVAQNDLSEERAVEFQFVQSEFRGILPKHYVEGKTLVEKTRHVPSDMNDLNKEEVSRYVPLDSCDYMIDLDMSASEREPDFRTMKKEWKSVIGMPFIDAANSHPLFRAFYVPYFSANRNKYTNYTLYRKVKSRS